MDIREFNKGTVVSQVPTKESGVDTTTPEVEAPKMDTAISEDSIELFLSENNIPKSTIFIMLDKLITEGTAKYNTTILGTVPVVFITRPEWINTILIQGLEDEAPKSVAKFQEIVAKYNLAGSLCKFKDQEYVVNNEEEYLNRLEAISKLASPIYSVLVEQLAIFDKIIGIATSTWAIKNFTKPLLEEPAQ